MIVGAALVATPLFLFAAVRHAIRIARGRPAPFPFWIAAAFAVPIVVMMSLTKILATVRSRGSELRRSTATEEGLWQIAE